MKKIKPRENSAKQEIYQYLILFDENSEENPLHLEKPDSSVFQNVEFQTYILFRVEDYMVMQAPPSEQELFLLYCRNQEALSIAAEKDYSLELNQISLEWSNKINISLIDVLEAIKYMDISIFYELYAYLFDIIENDICENNFVHLY